MQYAMNKEERNKYDIVNEIIELARESLCVSLGSSILRLFSFNIL